MRNLFTRGYHYIKNKGLKTGFRAISNLFRQYGFRGVTHGIANKIKGRPLLLGLSSSIENLKGGELELAILNMQQTELTIEEQKTEIASFKYTPLVSILVPLYNAPLQWLQIAIDSVLNQSYENWELCLVDDGSKDHPGKSFAKTMQSNDKRIHFLAMKKNGGISSATNAALKMASGEYVALLDQDDELTPDALFWFIKELQSHPDTDMLYSDECKTGESSTPNPHDFYLKPDWSPELLINHMYTGHLSMYRTTIVNEVGGFRSQYDFSQDYDLALRVTDKTDRIRHIDRVLYYWRALPMSGAAGGKDFARESNIAALADWYARKGLNAAVAPLPYANYGTLQMDSQPLLSIVIPSDSFSTLKNCIHALVSNTNYPNIEFVPVTNSNTAAELLKAFEGLTNLRICRYDKPFNFSDKCNKGVNMSKGDYVAIYNDDVLPISRDWVERLIEILQYPGVGGVSPMMLYENNSIQYAGMITGVPGLIGTSFNGLSHNQTGAFHQYLMRDVSVLCGACMLMKKSLFDALGGFNALQTPNGHSDVDLSFRIMEAGYRCVYTPHARMRHIGNHSWAAKASKDKSDIFCLQRWGARIAGDPYFTEPQRRLYYRDFSYKFKIFEGANAHSPENYKGDILFVTHELSLSGAPIVLKNMIACAMQLGYYPIVTCPIEGPLLDVFRQMGVTVIIDEAISNGHWLFEHFARNFDLVVVNTLACGTAIRSLENSLPPVLWWIHEGVHAYDCLKSLLPPTLGKNIYPVYAGNYARKVVTSRMKGYDGSILNFGLDCGGSFAAAESHKPVTFVISGGIERRKGQDVVIEAIGVINEKFKGKTRFIFVGKKLDDDIYDTVAAAAAACDNVELLAPIPYDDVLKLYTNSDCLIIPSRDEPTSAVALEGMALGMPCICSDHTGISSYIDDGVNGFVFPSEDVDKLVEKMTYIVEHNSELQSLRESARHIYEDYFSMPVFCSEFEKQLSAILSEN